MAKVLKKFHDKTTGRIYQVGEDFDGERQEYLASLGFIEPTPKRRKKPESDE
ncbi:hypothetical protein [Priestia megaterium]|uniref:hypothetical protein n=1 Tax=Priestia megaterium TaxID=1404 RepID=UPI0030088E28